jgi:small GTP-binding protein
MNDLDIIKQIEQQIGKKLEKLEKVEWYSVGYVINTQNQVTELSLYQCEMEQIPECLCDLIYLQTLFIIGNKIEKLPESFGQLQNLSDLELYNNQLKELPASFGQLQNLSYLSLSNNQLKELPASFGQLQNLSDLSLRDNQLKELPASFGQLQNLSDLNLGDNQLKELPASFGRIQNSCQLRIYNNPLETPPPEIAKQGIEAIRHYFESLEEQKSPLKEVKLLLVGDGGAGKTSLAKRFLGERFNAREPQTHGINIKPYYIQTQNKQAEDIEVKAHLWDFGGQEIMHATHQFFLSKRSVYILVLDGRKEEKTEYWLKHIESFGGDSPVLVVLNKIDENAGFDVNQANLRKKYKGIHSFHRVSCKKSTGIKPLQKALKQALTEVEILQTLWGKSWFAVKTALENLEKHYISYEYYQNLCEQHKITDSAQDTLVQFLHNLGIILHFNEFDLRDTYVLEPKWVTEAVYRIINSPQLAKNKGILSLNCLDAVLKPKIKTDYTYPRDKHRYIIRLMQKFELCYKIDDETILVPDLLSENEPEFDFDYKNSLKFKLEYDFLPRSIMPRFIVKRHTEIVEQLRWRTGVVLYDKTYDATAVIKSDNEDRTIQIWVAGKQKRDYFATVRKTLWDIHQTFEKIVVTELVPLPDHPDVCVSYNDLIGHYLENWQTIRVGEVRKEYNVQQLLDGIEPEIDTQRNTVLIQDNSRHITVKGNVGNSNLNTGDDNLQNK